MKIEINRIQAEPLILEETFSPGALDLETDSVKFSAPLKIRAEVSRITNAITANLKLRGTMHLSCSRCLNEFDLDLEKDLRLNYPVDKSQSALDLGPDIRQEIILDYPMKPLCRPDCKGLCPRCGNNLNEGGCSCATTKETTF